MYTCALVLGCAKCKGGLVYEYQQTSCASKDMSMHHT